MKKITLNVSVGLLLGLIAGYYFAVKFGPEVIPKNYVRVTVNNKSGHNIKLLTLKHERGIIEAKGLARQETVNMMFKNGGENSYRITATLDNDSVISSKGAYVENGYKMLETVFVDDIKTTGSK